jgi:ATP-dependent DNA helicase DinG
VLQTPGVIDEVFGGEGLLARGNPDYEVRPGQVLMARAVQRAIGEKRHLAVEAPCGIGKTFAYLAPAIFHALESDTRVVVCTANIALQEQIFFKDLPALAKALRRPFTSALIKGINNYLCLDRFEETRAELPTVTFDRAELAHYRRVAAWAGETKTGDVSDLDVEPLDAVWNRVNGVSELCNGAQCRFYDECFAMDARRKLRGAQIIVTNYHLFFAHLRVKSFGVDAILPAAPTVICDEAHEMADIARDFFGFRLTPYSINTLVRGANWLHKGGTADLLRRASRDFFSRVRDVPEKRLRKARWVDAGELLEAVGGYMDLLKAAREATEDEEARDKLAKFGAAAEGYVETLQAFLNPDDPNCVYWIDRDDRSARLQARVIDVGPVLQEQLFKTTPTVILTSATLTASGDFDFLRRETGAADLREASVASPFDFREQALLVIPPMRSGPNDPGFAAEMSASINRILRHLKGRTLCLFTSYKNLEACADAAEGLGVRILRQGDAPRSKLLDEFRRDDGTALFATSSFWQGVDVPGEALSCLVIDKIPFLNPGDPLLEALQERDPACFSNYSLPKATLDLRQGFGRLIRRKTDRGVVVIFDPRLLTKSYGAQILASLPDCPMARDLEALEAFLPLAR